MHEIVISQDQCMRMEQQAWACGSEECCGLLIGQLDGARGRVRRIVPAANLHIGDCRLAFALDPSVLAETLYRGRSRQSRLLGFYHSHPTSGPFPSAEDGRQAWPGMSYFILGRSHDGGWQAKSWRRKGAGGGFVEERIRRISERGSS